ncbi:signal peptide peptidase SppA [Candidatus Woesearchaeota archaeon]|nr:signal peptide peptidase SppA [Candidatus Woesearchaeota archaeon]
MKKYQFIILALGIIFLISLLISRTVETTKSIQPNKVALIPIYGTITVSSESDLFFGQSQAPSSVIIEALDKADKDPTIKAIILEINSPGGTVVASREIGNKIKSINKPVVSWIRELGASGAYWIASTSDYIIADPMSITGSIGVIGSYLEFSDLFEKYGVTYQRLVGGNLKDAGTPYKDLTNEERQFLQEKIDKIHDSFIKEVSINRKLDYEKVKKLSNGAFYLGEEALDFGLIDELGSKDEAVNKVKELANIKDAELVSFKKETSILDVIQKLTSYNSFYIGRGIGFSLFQGFKQENSYSNILKIA